jgi:hypothetical protein
MVCIGFMWLRIGTSGRLCEHGNELSGSIKCWECLEYVHNSWFMKKSFSPWS